MLLYHFEMFIFLPCIVLLTNTFYGLGISDPATTASPALGHHMW